MRILVYPHDLQIGGSQINAIDLAAAVAAAGHDVVVYGIPGPLVQYIEKRGLRFIPARRLKYRPAPSRIMQLLSIARRERIDLMHTYEWPPCLDAYYGAGILGRVPILCTELSMHVSTTIPRSVPLIMGTADLGDEARKRQRAPVWVLEPPINTTDDHPRIDGTDFRSEHRIGEHELLIVSVSRLAIDLKLDALVHAIDAVDSLAGQYPVRLVLVGDGEARSALETRARAVNDRWHREVISFAGAHLDPRSAYAAADVVVGMGSSALRALSIGRPVVVQGEAGFSETFAPETLDIFLRQGFYGIGAGYNAALLAQQLESLLSDAQRRAALGAYGREIVEKRFSLDRAAQVLLGIYEEVHEASFSTNLLDAAHSMASALKIEISNHDPRRKRAARQERERALRTAAASSGLTLRHANTP